MVTLISLIIAIKYLLCATVEQPIPPVHSSVSGIEWEDAKNVFSIDFYQPSAREALPYTGEKDNSLLKSDV